MLQDAHQCLKYTVMIVFTISSVCLCYTFIAIQDIVRHQRSTESMDALQSATTSVAASVEDLEDPSQVISHFERIGLPCSQKIDDISVICIHHGHVGPLAYDNLIRNAADLMPNP